METGNNCSERGILSRIAHVGSTQLAGPAIALLEVSLLSSASLSILDVNGWQLPGTLSQPAPLRLLWVMILGQILLISAGPAKTLPQKFGMIGVGLGLIGLSLLIIGASNLLLDRASDVLEAFELPEQDAEFDALSSKVALAACLGGWLVSYASRQVWKRSKAA